MNTIASKVGKEVKTCGDAIETIGKLEVVDFLEELKEALCTSLDKVPIEHKLTLSPHEAAELSNIGQNRIEKMLNEPNCPFVLFVGDSGQPRKRVKRKEFEEYLSKALVI